jgi:hypothetical protein
VKWQKPAGGGRELPEKLLIVADIFGKTWCYFQEHVQP